MMYQKQPHKIKFCKLQIFVIKFNVIFLIKFYIIFVIKFHVFFN